MKGLEKASDARCPMCRDPLLWRFLSDSSETLQGSDGKTYKWLMDIPAYSRRFNLCRAFEQVAMKMPTPPLVFTVPFRSTRATVTQTVTPSVTQSVDTVPGFIGPFTVTPFVETVPRFIGPFTVTPFVDTVHVAVENTITNTVESTITNTVENTVPVTVENTVPVTLENTITNTVESTVPVTDANTVPVTVEDTQSEEVDEDILNIAYPQPLVYMNVDGEEEEVQEAKNSGLRSILKQFTSFPVEAEISMSKQKQQQINSKKKGSRLYTEFQASQ